MLVVQSVKLPHKLQLEDKTETNLKLLRKASNNRKENPMRREKETMKEEKVETLKREKVEISKREKVEILKREKVEISKREKVEIMKEESIIMKRENIKTMITRIIREATSTDNNSLKFQKGNKKRRKLNINLVRNQRSQNITLEP
jgi:hypothetical protein